MVSGNRSANSYLLRMGEVANQSIRSRSRPGCDQQLNSLMGNRGNDIMHKNGIEASRRSKPRETRMKAMDVKHYLC